MVSSRIQDPGLVFRACCAVCRFPVGSGSRGPCGEWWRLSLHGVVRRLRGRSSRPAVARLPARSGPRRAGRGIGMTADVQTQDVLISAAIFSRSTYSSRASGARTIQRVRSVRGRARPRPPHGWTVGPDSHGLDGGKLINGMPRGVAALSGRLYRGPARRRCPSRGTQRAHRLPCVSSRNPMKYTNKLSRGMRRQSVSGPGRRQRTSSSRTRQGCRGKSPRGTLPLSCPPYPRCPSRTGAWASAARHAARGRVR
ncbi:hypothetical protein OK006_1908 [Actinobacteria bacterium OK006]|nr:hypothetical protein OK006_1908 [Actinobacteria bacterium OK006]